MSDNSGWTAERVEILKKLWADGLSANQVADELGGVTRNGVLGKIHRLGLPERTKAPSNGPPRDSKKLPRQRHALPAAPTPPAERLARSPATPQRTFRQEESVAVAETAVVAIPFDDMVVPMGELCTMLELQQYSCRWPIGESGKNDFRYCGARSGHGVPYCAYHASIAYQPVVDRRRDRGTKTR